MDMDKKEKLEMLQQLTEKELTQRILILLYESMGCKSIRYSHRKLEFGKDIVYYKEDEYGNHVFTGIQAKKTRIITSDVNTIFRQISEAFGEPFTDLSNGKKMELDKFILVTINEFSEEAKDSLWASLRGAHLNKLVTCLEGNQLINLIDKYLPSAFWNEYNYFSKYFNSLRLEFETIKDVTAFGQKKPVPLEDIYVSLKLINKVRKHEIPNEKGRNIFIEEFIERDKKIDMNHALEIGKIINSENAIKEYQRLVIVGAPGSGKTTLLKHLALKSCKENIEKLERTCIPIPVTLSEFFESGKELGEYIYDVFKKYHFPQAKKIIENDLKKGSCRLLLDGFDELVTKKAQDMVTRKIRKFADRYPKAQIIVTARIAGYHDELKEFTKLELMEFDSKQIELFIKNWFGKINFQKAQLMSKAIRENEHIKAIAQNPLMLAIIAIIHEEDRELPQRRVELYERCVDVLLNKWDVQKKIKNSYFAEKKEYILKKLAFYGHINNKKIFTQKEIVAEIYKYSKRIGLGKKDATPFLEEISQRSNLLRLISRNHYDFLHLSFQEYFTALELNDQKDGVSTVIKHLFKPWWEEPILLYAGIRKDASELIKRINKEVPEDIFYSNLILVGRCSADAGFTEPTLKENIIDDLWSLYQTTEFTSLRERAIAVLSSIKPDKLIKQLIRDLEHKKSGIRKEAAIALGKIVSEKPIEPLINTLNRDKDSEVRSAAAFALGKAGSEKAIEPLINTLNRDKDSEVRSAAAFALGKAGSEKAIEPLINALNRDKDNSVCSGAASSLGEIGSEKAIEVLFNDLTKVDKYGGYVPGNTLYALSRMRSKKVIDVLLFNLINSKDYWRQYMAVLVLEEIGEEADKAIEPLVNILNTIEDNKIRGEAASALGKVGGEKVIELLINTLKIDKDSKVRQSAAFGLGKIGSEKAIKPLSNAFIYNRDIYVQRAAILALAWIGSKESIKLLSKALTTNIDQYIRRSAAEGLGSVGGKKAVDLLINTLALDKNNDVRAEAANALRIIGNKKAEEPLIKAITFDKDSDVRVMALVALAKIGGKNAIKAIKNSLKDRGESWGVKGKGKEKVKDIAFISLEEISKRIQKRITG